MTRPYNERRNRQIFTLVDRRRVPPKDVPALMLKLGYFISYDTVRQILSRYAKARGKSVRQPQMR